MSKIQVKLKELEKRADNNDSEIFSICNDDPSKLDQFVDFHHTNRHLCVQILTQRLIDLQADINKGSLKVNWPMSNCHVYQIICGAGRNSKGGVGVLKVEVDKFLKNHNYDHYSDLDQG